MQVLGQDEQQPRKERQSRVSKSDALAEKRRRALSMDVDVAVEELNVDDVPPLELDSIIFSDTAPPPPPPATDPAPDVVAPDFDVAWNE